MPLALGVDSSTQSTKVEARDLDTGDVVAAGAAAHPPTTPPVSEQDPAAWWAALVSSVEQLGDHRRDVVAMSIAGQQHGLVLLDDAGSSLRPAKLWNDTTSSTNADRLVAGLGAGWWAASTGSVPVASFTVAKLAWVAEHEPALLERIARIMLPHDYLTWRLTGEHVTDRGDASGTGWFDPSTDSYLVEPLSAAVGATAGPEVLGRLPTVLGPSAAAGTVTDAAASALGLGPDVVVGPGSGDNMGAALGLGLRSGDVAISLGTSGTVFAVSSTATHDENGAVAGFASAAGSFLPPTRSPTGPAPMRPVWRPSPSQPSATPGTRCSCPTSTANGPPTFRTRPARSKGSRPRPRASSWLSPPMTACCAGSSTASMPSVTSAPRSTAGSSSSVAAPARSHTAPDAPI
jgi:xylulokinase